VTSSDDLVRILEKLLLYNSGNIDVAKHLTTLSTGVIVLAATFSQKVSVAAHAQASLRIGIALLVLSVVIALIHCAAAQRAAGTILQFIGLLKTWEIDPQASRQKMDAIGPLIRTAGKTSDWLFTLAVICFVFGIVSVGIFAELNI
jgi:hypothetical protein